MKLTLGRGRVALSCPNPECDLPVEVGPPAHQVTVGLSTGVTISPAAVCPHCAIVFDIRRGKVRGMGGYGLPPRQVAYVPETRPASEDAIVVSPAGSGDSASSPGEDVGVDEVDDAEAGRLRPTKSLPEPVDVPEPEAVADAGDVEAPAVPPSPVDFADPGVVIDASAYTKLELSDMCASQNLPTSGTKVELEARLNWHLHTIHGDAWAGVVEDDSEE